MIRAPPGADADRARPAGQLLANKMAPARGARTSRARPHVYVLGTSSYLCVGYFPVIHRSGLSTMNLFAISRPTPRDSSNGRKTS
jgi:hypothetical protein